jgi:hypothetical protein
MSKKRFSSGKILTLLIATMCFSGMAHAVERALPEEKPQIEMETQDPSVIDRSTVGGFCAKWVCKACRRIKGSTDGGTFLDKEMVACSEINPNRKPPKCNYKSSAECTSEYDSPAFKF